MITSTNNDRIKNIVQLNSSSKARHTQNAFVAEGIKMFMEAPLLCINEVYLSEELHDRINIAVRYDDDNDEGQLLKKCAIKLKETGYEEVSAQVFKKMSDTVTPQGILTVVRRERHRLEEFLEGKDRSDLHVLILENLQDPGNMGTMIRTAEAAGYDLIVANEGTVDMYNPKVIRSTMGSIYRVPVIYSQALSGDIDRLKDAGVQIYAAHLKAKRDYREISFGRRIAVMIGNEGNGLSDEIASKADEYIKIPMQGQVESLNAAVAAALLMFSSVHR
ncbi:MAG: RNA methyltransferase [Lachnospiraceae bacterium]|nr:RNA methyltransferase [Lachnospiraceae bacterium]